MTVTLAAAMALGVAVVSFVLGAALLLLRFHHPANRALCLYLGLRGMTFALLGLEAAQGADPGGFLARMVPYFQLPLGVPVLAFLLVYPRRRAPWPAKVPPLLPFLAVVAAMDVAYALDHGLRGSVASPGPLLTLGQALSLANFLAALVLARDFLRAPPGPERSSMLLLSAGLSLILLFDAVEYLMRPAGLGAPNAWVYAGRLGLAGGVVALLLAALRRPDPEARRGARRYLGAIALAMASAALVPRAGEDALRVAALLWDLSLPLLVTYAMVRHQLFDIDLKVRWTVKQSTVAAAFVGVFFVVSESASSFLATEGGLGTYLGIAAAGLLVFAIAPLQRAAERVASAAMPGVRAAGDLTRDERLELYREQLRIAWSDGALSADERRLLSGMRAKLGISPEDALRVEQEVAP